MSNSSLPEPEGALVSTTPSLFPSPITLRSSHSALVKSITLKPLSSAHASALYSSFGGTQNANMWRYIGAGPYYDFDPFNEFVRFLLESKGNVPFALLKKDDLDQNPPTDEVEGEAVGIISLGPVVPLHRSLEIGLLLSPQLQRTTAATEAMYLLLKHCFEELAYRRVEWKTNNLNESSRRAAERLGFVLEGVFRKHMIVKGRSRDTAWFSMTDDDWNGGIKAALEEWLNKKNFDENGKQLRKLEEVRKCTGMTDK